GFIIRHSPLSPLALIAASRAQNAFANGAQLARLGAAAEFAGLLVILALAQLLEQAAPLQQLLKAAQGRTDRLTVVDAHPQRHVHSWSPARAGQRSFGRDCTAIV